MSELYTSTAKYFHLAICEFLPRLKELKSTTRDQSIKEQLEDLIEAYNDIARKIGKYGLNATDPNRYFNGEPHDIQIDISDKLIENLSRLSQRLLLTWQQKLQRIQRKEHVTEKNEEEKHKLENLIWPLEAQLQNKSSLIGKHADKGFLEFPGEDDPHPKEADDESTSFGKKEIFSASLIKKIPKDVGILCAEFNFNYAHDKPNAGMLLLRRILPLAIVRKFQVLNKEKDIKDKTGEFLDTKALLGKIESHVQEKRIYKEILGYKSLVDSSQHSYSLNVDMTDTEGAGIKIRIFLDHIF